MGFMELAAVGSVLGNVAYGYAIASGAEISQGGNVVGIMNYFVTPLGLFGNGVCNMPDEYGRGPVDYANTPQRNGMALSKNKDGSVEIKTINRTPTRRVGNLEVGLAQGVSALAVNTLALFAGAGIGLLSKKISGN